MATMELKLAEGPARGVSPSVPKSLGAESQLGPFLCVPGTIVRTACGTCWSRSSWRAASRASQPLSRERPVWGGVVSIRPRPFFFSLCLGLLLPPALLLYSPVLLLLQVPVGTTASQCSHV